MAWRLSRLVTLRVHDAILSNVRIGGKPEVIDHVPLKGRYSTILKVVLCRPSAKRDK